MDIKNTARENIINFGMLTVGAILAAFAVEEFLAPNKIFDGGIVGISMILSHYIPIKLGILTVIINLPFILYALYRFGRIFFISAAYSMVVFSIMLSAFEEWVNVTYDSLLATVFGGIFLGVGVGLVLRGGGCLDGTEIVGISISRKHTITVGRFVLLINIVIYTVAGFLFGLDSGMYSILMYFITSRAIDIIEVGWEQGKAIMIITESGKLIADEIYKNFGRTVTFISGQGLISGTTKDVLYCVITRAEINELRKMIRNLNVDAFITVTDVSEIIGNHVKKKGDEE